MGEQEIRQTVKGWLTGQVPRLLVADREIGSQTDCGDNLPITKRISILTYILHIYENLLRQISAIRKWQKIIPARVVSMSEKARA